ncbi:MAG TPA: sugar transferase [Candidatus Binataceae bacterium]|nr:sugar transferase [Candidatus Binataceae bacterium]
MAISVRRAMARELLMAVDALILSTSYLVGYSVYLWFHRERFGIDFSAFHALPFVIIAWLFLLHRMQLYRSASYDSSANVVAALVKVQVMGGLILFSTLYLLGREALLPRIMMSTFLLASLGAFIAEKIAVKWWLDRERSESDQRRKILVIGTDERALDCAAKLRDSPFWNTEIVGFAAAGGERPALALSGTGTGGFSRTTGGNSSAAGPILGSVSAIHDILEKFVVDEVVLSAWSCDETTVNRVLSECAERGLAFRTLVAMPGAFGGSFTGRELHDGSYMISFEPIPLGRVPLTIKRLVDIGVACAGLAACGVVYVCYAPWLRRQSPGPVFFRQTRIGQNGRRFVCHKFRTMYPDAEEQLTPLKERNQMRGKIFKLRDDPRVVPGGEWLRRHYLDELPQFWNVLKGDMSVVGTRPPLPSEVADYAAGDCRRLSMRPGITGLWQLEGNAAVADFGEVVKLDCRYIDNWSLWLDFVIMMRTAAKVFHGGGW